MKGLPHSSFIIVLKCKQKHFDVSKLFTLKSLKCINRVGISNRTDYKIAEKKTEFIVRSVFVNSTVHPNVKPWPLLFKCGAAIQQCKLWDFRRLK